ncbi:MAG: MarR family transcriptional regulator [Aquisalimonadaceae bacterium]
MKPERLQNLIGTLALTISDDLLKESSHLVPRDEPAAAIALVGRSPGWTIRQLSTDLVLSHAATVRLVDRLVDDGLMRRRRSATDGRAVALSLTSKGQSLYQEMLVRRHQRLGELLSSLTDEEKHALGVIGEKLLVLIAKTTDNRSRACRFCDTESCRRCPFDVALST